MSHLFNRDFEQSRILPSEPVTAPLAIVACDGGGWYRDDGL
jgi:hypothetical protein